MRCNIIMPTIGNAPLSLQQEVFSRITTAAAVHDAQCIVCAPEEAVLPPIPGWTRLPLARQKDAYRDCYARLLLMLKACNQADPVFIVEHDVLYPVTYFSLCADERSLALSSFNYQVNLMTLTKNGWNIHTDRLVTSQLCSSKVLLEEHFTRAVAWLDAGCQILWDEPGLDWADDGIAFPKVAEATTRRCFLSAVDVRWGGNLTGDRKFDPKTGKKVDGCYGEYSTLRKGLGV